MRKRKKNVFMIVVTTILVFVFAFAIGMVAIYYKYDGGRVKLDSAALTADGGTVYYDKYGAVIDKTLYGSSAYVNIDDAQPNLYNAFIAVEDKRFYEHKGIDYRRIVGASIKNIKAGRAVEGASTITQQVIKNTHLTPEKTLSRKLTEMRLARELEKKASKREILEIYLNKIYFGKNIYGVGGASKAYFNKELNDLTAAECALLASIPKNPAKYMPMEKDENISALTRAKTVLRLMYEQQYLTEAEYKMAIEENPKYLYDKKEQPYALSYIRSAEEETAKKLGIKVMEVRKGNYKIYTNLDMDLLTTAVKTLNGEMYAPKNENGISPNGAVVVMNNADCSISCYYSPEGVAIEKISRQIGSLMKPIGVYAPAIESGIYYESSVVLDEKKDFDGYSPSNFNNAYHGYVSLRTALCRSMNVPAVEVYSSLDPNYLMEYSSSINMPINKNDGLARAIGGTTDGISLVDTISAYSMLARGGSHKRGYFVREIGGADKIVFGENAKNASANRDSCSVKKDISYHGDKAKRVLSEGTSYIVTDMLRDAVKNGTSRQLSTLPYHVASKTGTVAYGADGKNSDIWNASYTSEHAVLVWQGMTLGEENTALDKSATGGKYPTIIARQMYEKLYSDHSPKNFDMPDSVAQKNLDSYDYNENQKVTLAPDFIGETAVKGLFLKDREMPELSTSYKMPTEFDFIKTIYEDQTTITLKNKSRNIDYEFFYEDIFGFKQAVDYAEREDGYIITVPKFSAMFGGKIVAECKYKDSISQDHCNVKIYL